MTPVKGSFDPKRVATHRLRTAAAVGAAAWMEGPEWQLPQVMDMGTLQPNLDPAAQLSLLFYLGQGGAFLGPLIIFPAFPHCVS